MRKFDRREFVKMGLAAGSLCALGSARNVIARVAGSRDTRYKVIVLGFDGMDPHLTEQFMKQGKLPSLQKLAGMGGFRPLRTSTPPQSPVAWSNFITGMNPGGHAIFDFIHRNPKDYSPFLSTSTVTPGERTLNIGSYVIPLSSGEVLLLRRGDAFWQILEKHGIPATVYKMPSNFPPAPTEQRTISGMGTPDIMGGYGVFNYYTTAHAELRPHMDGGEVHQVSVVAGKVQAKLPGPPNAFRKGNPDTYIDFTVFLDPANPVAKIEIQDQEFILAEGEWSDWKRVEFPLIPTQGVPGICKFHLKQAHPEFKLYVSPVNLDPGNPALPISTPESYSEDLDEKFGPFYTKGLPADTKALEHGVLDDAEFLAQDGDVLAEDGAIFDYELGRFDSGLLFYYFSSTDQRQHMFWRYIDKEHPAYDPSLAGKYGGAIEDIYVAMDRVVSKVMSKVDKDTMILAMSDHGFTPFRRAFNLNTWLKESGYMRLISERRRDAVFFENTDWSRTRAYALGLNGLYVNQRDREGKGIVAPGADSESLIREIARKLEEVTDPQTGERVITRAYVAKDVYQGAYVNEAPDILVGYNRGYRCSWATPLGKVPPEVLEDNKEKWSGDHCMDPDVIPGILFTNAKVTVDFPALYDLTASILHVFGIEKPASMVGNNVLQFPV
ncbi:MAG: alkaline phosphatase family protein [Acidobacteriota bacterium]